MRRNWLTGLLVGAAVAVVVFLVADGLLAQGTGSTGGPRVVCLDVIHIFNEYQRQKDLTEEIKQLRDRLQNEDQQRRQKIDAAQATLDAMNRNDPAYVKKMGEQLEMQIDYKNWGEAKQAHMTREVGFWTANIYREMVSATEQVAQTQGFDMVLYREDFDPPTLEPEALRDQIRLRKLVYAAPTIDITQIVLDKLNINYRAQPKTNMIFIP